LNADLMTKLQSQRGYQGWRIRPHPSNPATWLAESIRFLGVETGRGSGYYEMENGGIIGPSQRLNKPTVLW